MDDRLPLEGSTGSTVDAEARAALERSVTQLPAMPFELVLSQWADEARRGRASDFRDWTFFETNCLSELVKLTRNGSGDAVKSFLRGRDVLLPGTVLSEIFRVPEIAREVGRILSPARVFLVPDISKFWECDLWNFISVDGHHRNVLETTLIPEDLLSGLSTHRPFVEAVRKSRAILEAEYQQRVQPDVGAELDERQLLAHIWFRINTMAMEWLKLEIPVADARPDRFPAFFTFYYAYYFRYVKSRTVKIQVNDFNDLANTVAAPYCRDFFTEKTIAGILRNDVQARVPPRPIDAARRLKRRGVVSTESFNRAMTTEAQTSANEPLLEATRIWSINDLRQQVASAASTESKD